MSEERWDFWEEIGRRLKGVVGYQVQAKKQVFFADDKVTLLVFLVKCFFLQLINRTLEKFFSLKSNNEGRRSANNGRKFCQFPLPQINIVSIICC